MVEHSIAQPSRRAAIAGGAAWLVLYPAGRPHAQTPKGFTIGWLSSAPDAAALLGTFQAELRAMGYAAHRPIQVEVRSAQDNLELRALARELVRLKVDVLVTTGRAATRAAQEASRMVPIVMAPVDDPFEFVASVSRPTGNITGLALQQTEIDAKQIEILKEVAPAVSRLAIFYYYGETYYTLESVARAIGIEPVWIPIKQEDDLDRAFGEALSKGANGLLIVDATALGAVCNRIAAMALERRIPAAASWRGTIQTKLLLAYAADETHLQQRAAFYVDRLLRGAKPQELPIEQVSQFDLIVNLRSARELGLKVPHPVLLRASEVIE